MNQMQTPRSNAGPRVETVWLEGRPSHNPGEQVAAVSRFVFGLLDCLIRPQEMPQAALEVAAAADAATALSNTPPRAVVENVSGRVGLPHMSDVETARLAAACFERIGFRGEAQTLRWAAKRLSGKWALRPRLARGFRFVESQATVIEALADLIAASELLEITGPEEAARRLVAQVSAIPGPEYQRRLEAAARVEAARDAEVVRETMNRRAHNRKTGSLLLMPDRPAPRWQLLRQTSARFLSERPILPGSQRQATPLAVAAIETTEGPMWRVSYADVDLLQNREGAEVARLANPIKPDPFAPPSPQWTEAAAPPWQLRPTEDGHWTLVH